MINVQVFSEYNISIEMDEYHIVDQRDMITFLRDLLDKVYYSGETICLEKADISQDIVSFTEIDRWKKLS